MLLSACFGSEQQDPYAEADWLFEPDRVLDVDIEIADEDWDALRFQTRNLLELFGEGCGAAPYDSPFTYVPATVTVDGIEVAEVGIRKKGFLGSLDEDKPSLKLKLDEYVAGQRLSGARRLTLNNAKQDPSHMNQCLGYELFSLAGVPAPRCNFATVSVNGRPLGVYVNVESVKKPFLGRHFADDEGNLYEGTLSDFREGWTATFDRKTNESDPDRGDIQAVVDALALDDEAMAAELDRLIDLERFYSFWAVETMTSHWDGYSGNNNNFFLYGDPTTGKLVFLPWGADQLFGNSTADHDPAATASALTRRLYLYAPTRQRYLDRYAEILDEVWDDAALLAQIDAIDARIGPAIGASESTSYAEAVDRLRATVEGREAILRDNLEAAGVEAAEELSPPLCFSDVGPGSSSFTASYSGGPSAEATLAVTINGAARTLTGVNAHVGPDDERPDRTVLFLTATDEGGRQVILFIALPDALAGAGTVGVGSGQVEAVLVFQRPGAPQPEELYFPGGTLELGASGLEAGASWQGNLDLRIWDPPFF